MFSFDEFSGKQIRWIGLGLLLGFFILLIDWRVFDTYAYPIYIGMLLLLIVTPFLAHDIKGSRSWLTVGPMSLQPAEFAKFATALALAKLFSGYNFTLNAKAINYVKALAIIILPIVFILLQNETARLWPTSRCFCALPRGHERTHIVCRPVCSGDICSGREVHRYHVSRHSIRRVCYNGDGDADNDWHDIHILSHP